MTSFGKSNNYIVLYYVVRLTSEHHTKADPRHCVSLDEVLGSSKHQMTAICPSQPVKSGVCRTETSVSQLLSCLGSFPGFCSSSSSAHHKRQAPTLSCHQISQTGCIFHRKGGNQLLSIHPLGISNIFHFVIVDLHGGRR